MKINSQSFTQYASTMKTLSTDIEGFDRIEPLFTKHPAHLNQEKLSLTATHMLKQISTKSQAANMFKRSHVSRAKERAQQLSHKIAEEFV